MSAQGVRRMPKYGGWRLFLMTVIARAYPRVIGQQRDRSWLVFDVVFPVISVSAYVFIYRAINAPEAYIGFVVMGGAMTAFWLNVLWMMSSQLYWEKQQGNLALFIMSPTSMTAILLGMALGGIVATVLRALGITLLGSWMFNVHYSIQSYSSLFGVFILTMVALYGMGMMNSSLFLLLSREAWHLSNLAQEPIYLVSGFYFPVRSLGFWVAAAASIVPLTLGMDAMRQLVFAGGVSLGFLSVPVELGILACLSILFLAGARFLLAYMERLAIREGRLTESRR